MENTRSEICARGGHLNKRKRNTRIYIVSLVSISHGSRNSDRLKNAKESGASVYARGRRANKRKKDKKIMFLSRVSHLVLLHVLSDPDNTRSERLDFVYLMSALADQLM